VCISTALAPVIVAALWLLALPASWAVLGASLIDALVTARELYLANRERRQRAHGHGLAFALALAAVALWAGATAALAPLAGGLLVAPLSGGLLVAGPPGGLLALGAVA
jgi:hypothetical protein